MSVTKPQARDKQNKINNKIKSNKNKQGEKNMKNNMKNNLESDLESGLESEQSKRKLENKQNELENELEKCIICDAYTNIKKSTPVQERDERYVEGAGQLCAKCYEKIYRQNKTAKTALQIDTDFLRKF